MEWIAVSIGIGLIVSLLFTEAFGLSVGGMIVPGYLALYFNQPVTIVLTLVAALATWGVVRLLNRWAILFGRRRVVVTMVIGFAIASIARAALQWATVAMMDSPQVAVGMSAESQAFLVSATVIGFVIPGLIALWIDRTGVIQTLSPLLVASSLVRLVLVMCGIEAVT
tara:strand:+ start:981874 stop:982377 length:504 start_codon:yes stop_codon:yes gene_type:complete